MAHCRPSEQERDEAYRHGYITADERKQLHSGHVFAVREEEYREGQVNLFLSQEPLRKVHGIGPLLRTWGGEGIYMSSGAVALRPRLEQLGKPSIVVADVDLCEGWRTHAIYPSLDKVFVDRVLDFENGGASVHHRAAVPAAQVLGIWRPGDPQYDQFGRLPRE